VGETQVRRVDVRLISATNRDLAEEVRAGRFREDLFYRISEFPVCVPPLRERAEDIPLLVARFVRESNERLGKQVAGVTPGALDRLARHAWPGNVRELQNEIARAVTLTPDGSSIPPDHLSERILAESAVPLAGGFAQGTLREARLAFECEYIADVLCQHDGNATRTAKALGISRQALHAKIREYGLR
jgi:Nif-specific regulatory protein